MGFERAGIDYEVVGISEIDKYALKSYQAMHGECPNFGSITEIKGQDLPQIDVFTWSFPCTDLSKAGKQKGLTNTRSGLVYEVLRILQECKVCDNLPKVLIMENVVDLVQSKFIREFQEIQLELENLGYTNYTDVINAKDCGVPQTRDRVFMVSVLGDYYYEFNKPIKLLKSAKEMLIKGKYYDITDSIKKRYEKLTNKNDFEYWLNNLEVVNGIKTLDLYTFREMNILHQIDSLDIVPTITTRNFTNHNFKFEMNGRIYKPSSLSSWLLMGIDEKYYDKAKNVVKEKDLFRQSGNGIVVDVFAAIVRQLL